MIDFYNVKSDFAVFESNDKIKVFFTQSFLYKNQRISVYDIPNLKGELNSNFCVTGSKVFFVTVMERANSGYDRDFCIYSYDLETKSLKILEEYKSNTRWPKMFTFNDRVYIEKVFDNSEKNHCCIGVYDAISGAFIEDLNQTTLFDYKKEIGVESYKQHSYGPGESIIINSIYSDKKYIIDDNTLNNSEEGLILKKYDYKYDFIFENAGNDIYVCYKLNNTKHGNYIAGYAEVIFQYDEENNKLIYQNVFYNFPALWIQNICQ